MVKLPARVDASMESLLSVATKVNQVTDLASEAVRDVEEVFADCNIGTRVIVDAGVDPNTDLHQFLEYKKIGGAYRVGVSDENSQTRLWCECTRELKLLTVSALPALIAQIRVELESQAKLATNAEAAVTAVRSMLYGKKERA